MALKSFKDKLEEIGREEKKADKTPEGGARHAQRRSTCQRPSR